MGNDNKISKLKNIYSNGNLIPFLGAGMSVPFGLPSWKQLIYNLGSKVNCNKEVLNTIEKALNNGEYLITIEFLKAAYGLSEDDIKENVRNIISQSIPLKKEMSKIDNNYKDINKYDNFNLIFTTNYDEVASQFIDTSLSPINLIIQRNNIQNAFNNSIGEKQIVHLHGSISAEETIVFTQKSYNDIYNDDMYVDTLKTYLNTKTFLFIGFSFDDMYMQHIWFENLKKFRSKHFILLDKPDNKIKKELKEKYNLETIEYDSSKSSHVKEIRKILDEVCNKQSINENDSSNFSDKSNLTYLNQFKEYYKKIKKSSGSIYLSKINTEIFPGLKNEMGIEFYDETNNNVSLYKFLNTLPAKNRGNAILVGEGGMGKTVSFLLACEKFLEEEKYAVYVPLYEINKITKSDRYIESYLDNYIWQKNLGNKKEFINYIKTKKKKILLLLDGFNEVTDEKRETISNEIENLLIYDNIQIIISSRFDLRKDNGWLTDLKLLTIQPLKRSQIEKYLMHCNIAFDKIDENLFKLLECPLMLTLFANTEGQYEKYKDVKVLEWKREQNTEGEIIWNFLQCQTAKVLNQFITDKILGYIIAIEYITSYIGWKMYTSKCYSISEETLYEYLEESCNYFKKHFQKNEPLRIKKIKLSYSRHEIDWNYEKLFKYILNDLHLIYETIDNEYSFIHQQFRDCYAAIFIINDLELHKWNGQIDSVNEEPFDYSVSKLLGELMNDNNIDKLWKNFKNKSYDFSKEKYCLHNIIEFIKCKYKYNLSRFDFSNMNLSKISLKEVSFNKGTKFNNSIISNLTFLPEGHSGIINSAKFFDNDTKCISGSEDRTIKIWDIKTGHCIYSITDINDSIAGLHIYNRKLFVYTGTNYIYIWNLTDYTLEKKQHIDYEKRITCIEINELNKIILCFEDGKVILWNIEENREEKCLLYDSVPTCISISKKLNICLIGFKNGKIKLLNLKSFITNDQINLHNDTISSISIVESTNSFISISDDKTIINFDIDKGKSQRINLNEKIKQLSVAKNNEIFLIALENNQISLWDYKNFKKIRDFGKQRHLVKSLDISESGLQFISGSYDNTIRIWDISTGMLIKELQGYNNWIRGICFHPSNDYFLTGSYDMSIKIWDTNTFECIKCLKGHKNWVRSIDCSFKNNICVSGSYDNTIKIWDIDNEKCIKTLIGHKKWISSVAFSPDSQKIASGSYDHSVIIWDLIKNKHKVLTGHNHYVRSVAFSKNGKNVISGSYDKTIKIWDTNTGRLINTLKGHNNYVRCIATTSSKIISGSYDKTVRIWSLGTGKCLKVLKGHNDWIRCLTITSDEKKIITGSDDKTIKIWDIKTGKCIKTLEGHTNWIGGLACSIDNKILISGSDDNTIKIWSMDNYNCIKTINCIPNLEVLDCIFTNASFDNKDIKQIIKDNGGILDE